MGPPSAFAKSLDRQIGTKRDKPPAFFANFMLSLLLNSPLKTKEFEAPHQETDGRKVRTQKTADG